MYKFSPRRLIAPRVVTSTVAGALTIAFITAPAFAQGSTEGKAAPKQAAAEEKTTKQAPQSEPTSPKEATGAKDSDAEEAPSEKAGEAKAAGDSEQEAGEAGAQGETTEEAAPAAPTEEDRETARLAFEGGMEAFEEENYSEAAKKFQEAQETIPSPHALYWIAKSIDAADPEDESPQATAQAYDRFLTNPGAKHVGAEEVAAAQKRLNELRKLLPATLVVLTDPSGATVKLDGKTLEGTTPLEIQKPAGTYQLEANKEGYEPLSLEVELEGGTTLEQQINLAKTPPPPPPETTEEPATQEPEKEPSMVPAYVTLGLGGAGLITGTVFGILALDGKSQFDQNPSNALADEVERNALIADMSFGIAVTLGVTGVVLLTADRTPDTPSENETAKNKSQKEAGRVIVAPYGSPWGGGARARMKF